MKKSLYALVLVLAMLVSGVPSAFAQAASQPPATAAPAKKTAGKKTLATAANPVNINTADVTALQTLPGVGPAIAERIIEQRKALGGKFAKVEDLMTVRGIGEVRFGEMKALVRVQ